MYYRRREKRETPLLPYPRCEICDVEFTSEPMKNDHLKGRKHIERADLIQREQAETERSIFISKLNHKITLPHLSQHFVQYGQISNVFLEPKKRVWAFIEFRSKDSVTRACDAGAAHCVNGHMVAVSPKEYKPPPKHITSTSQYNKRGPQGRPAPSKVAKEVHIDYRDISNELAKAQDVSEQLMLLQQYLTLTGEDFDERLELASNVQDIIAAHLPGSTVHIFGSSANGFGWRGCDMDLFADLHLDEHINMWAFPKHPLPSVYDLAPAIQVIDDRISRESVSAASDTDKVKLLQRIIRHTNQFADIQLIPGNRIPLVRFVHVLSGMKVDMTINSELAIQNTQLLRLMTAIDDRFAEVFFAIRYWARAAEVMLTPPRLTSYSLALMVMFFLQNTKPPVLPTVEALAELADVTTKVGEHDCSMPTSHTVWSGRGANTDSSDDLLRFFFSSYTWTKAGGRLDLSSVVLNLRSGKMVPVGEFRETLTADPSLAGFKLGPVNIQDPFQLSHNTGVNVNDKQGLVLQEKLRYAADCVLAPQYDTGDLHGQWGLLMLFTWGLGPHPVHIEQTWRPSNPGQLPPSQQPPYMGGSMAFSFTYNYDEKVLPERFFTECTAETRYDMWSLEVVSIYRQVVYEILRFECDTDPSSTIELEPIPQDLKRKRDEEDAANEVKKPRVATYGVHFVHSHTLTSAAVTGTEAANGAEDKARVTLKTKGAEVKVKQKPVEVKKKPVEVKQKPMEVKQKPVEVTEKPVEVKPEADVNPEPEELGAVGGRRFTMGEKLQETEKKKTLMMHCETKFSVWCGRNKLRKTVGGRDPFQSEKQVTDTKMEAGEAPGVVVHFDTKVTTRPTSGVIIELNPTKGHGEFNNMFQALKSIFERVCRFKLARDFGPKPTDELFPNI